MSRRERALQKKLDDAVLNGVAWVLTAEGQSREIAALKEQVAELEAHIGVAAFAAEHAARKAAEAKLQELALFRDTLKPGSRLERQLTNVVEGRHYDAQ
jgi:hypothetical protein